MNKTYLYLILLLATFSCAQDVVPTKFSQEALKDYFLNVKGQSITLKEILNLHQGKTIFIDIWASWCGDCRKGMPKVKVLQKDYPNLAFVFFSMDRNQKAWKKYIKANKIEGDHYFMPNSDKSAFGKFVNVDWIPRYMIVDSSGNIKLFKAVKADDIRIKKQIK